MDQSIGSVDSTKVCLFDLVQEEQVFRGSQVFREAADSLPNAALHQQRCHRACPHQFSFNLNRWRHISHHRAALEQCVGNWLEGTIDHCNVPAAFEDLNVRVLFG
jgi:hypothetical protein